MGPVLWNAGTSTLKNITRLLKLALALFWINCATGCQFYPIGEYLKFIRVPENLPLGAEVFSLEVHPRSHLTIMPVDKEEDVKYFAYKDINATHISVVLVQSLEDLVDSEIPRNLLKFRFICDYADGVNSLTSSHLSVTVYVEDINDHAPQFIGTPYHVTVEEFTPTGMTIFRGIHAFDGDKPNTPNSDVHYAIVKGNENGKFSLESGHRTALILRKPLDYDTGDRQFSLVITATDRGSPVKSVSTTVKVNVLDNDDLGPKFTQDVYRARIYESFPFPNGRIHNEIKLDSQISAKDQDTSINTPVKYSIISGNERRFFQLDSENGSLFLQHPIDLDNERLINNTIVLHIHATQIDNSLKYASAKIEIEILDLNDNLPEFEVDFYNISIVENLPNGFSVLQVLATDKDQGENSEFKYTLDDLSGAFTIDPRTGWLTVRDERVLDREQRSSLKMKVSAVEKKPSVISTLNENSSVQVEMTLLDANDNNPIFLPTNVYEFSLRNDVKIGTVIGQVQAMDNDLGKNGLVRYGLQRTGNASNTLRIPFSVDARTGVITVSESPIVEGRHAIFVEATDQPANPSERRFSLAVVTVDVYQLDNDEKSMPDFVGSPYEFWVGANVPVGTSVGQIRINSAAGKKNDIVYDLLHSYHEGVPFAVEERTGMITVIENIEKFSRRSYEFEGVVTNEKDLILATNVSVHVVDPNDERDLFIKGTTRVPLVFHVKENVPGAFIGQVLPRNGTNATRSVHFLIANQRDVPDIAITEDGDLYTVRGLDRETKQNYSITVIAETSRGLGVFQVNVVIDDINDNPPVFDLPSYVGRIKENSRPGTEVILENQITTHDADDHMNKNFRFILDGEGSNNFSIDRSTGKISLRHKVSLDREEKSVYMLQIIATDDINPISAVPLIIKIEDENDNTPIFMQMIVTPDQGISVTDEDTGKEKPKDVKNSHYSPLLSVPENATIGTMIIRLVAQDKDETDIGKITYAISNEVIYPSLQKLNIDSKPHFIVNSKSGELSVARPLPSGRKIHLDIVARDSANQTDNVRVKIIIEDVNDHPPVFKKSWYEFDIPEGIYSKYKIGEIMADDVDMGENSRISYKIDPFINLQTNLTFEITQNTGILTVTGSLDRETRDTYQIVITAHDNGIPRLNSSVDVEINVLDRNDNPPEFYGYENIYENEDGNSIPVYYTSVMENIEIGTVISRVYANDSDFTGNGNGLILFDIYHAVGQKPYFIIDSKDGEISTMANLDFEYQKLHNVTIIARDLGYPSLTSTAMLYVEVLDVDELEGEHPVKPVFQHRYYEVEVEENSIVPMKLLQLNVSETYVNERMRYGIISNNSEIENLFTIDADNGTLVLMKKLDREYKNSYEFRVKVDWPKTGRGMPAIIYPITDERLGDLKLNEAKIVVRVRDTNDNAPRFKTKGRPLLAAIPASINYGHEIIRVEAEDPDEGLNGEIRYQILGQEDAPRFAIDPLSGQVRSVVSFSQDAGRVFGFDVKATDRCGSENGRSSITNVFVYVVDDNKQVVMVMGRKPTEIENQVEEITGALQNLTGLDVRVRKLEPHIEKNLIDATSTDVYLYAVDPNLNVMIEMDRLHSVFRRKKSEIKGELERYRVLEITGNTPRRGNQRYLLSTIEMGLILLGCVVFVGALVTALCVACVRRNKRRCRDMALGAAMFPGGGPVGFALAQPTTTLRKPSLYPTFVDGLRYDPEPFTTDSRRLSICEHEPSCIRHQQGGYEDSLKSNHRVSSPNINEHTVDIDRQTGTSGERQRVHSLSRAESIYARDASLHREMRYRTNNEKRPYGNHHCDRGTHDNIHHVSRTMLREHPGNGSDKANIVRLHGPAGSSHSLFW